MGVGNKQEKLLWKSHLFGMDLSLKVRLLGKTSMNASFTWWRGLSLKQWSQWLNQLAKRGSQYSCKTHQGTRFSCGNYDIGMYRVGICHINTRNSSFVGRQILLQTLIIPPSFLPLM